LSPNSCWKNGPGEVGLPVAFGGISIGSGDVLVGDSDGVAVISATDLQVVISEMPKIKAREAEMEKIVGAGARRPAWLDETFASRGIRYLD
jgi:4-hydroxy-4-methyl-2-oxoglutarate aldolase